MQASIYKVSNVPSHYPEQLLSEKEPCGMPKKTPAYQVKLLVIMDNATQMYPELKKNSSIFN